MTSFPSTATATGKTGPRPRVQGAHITHSATMGRIGVTTPQRRESSRQQQPQSQPPPGFAIHPSISSSGRGGDTAPGRTARSRGNRSSATWTSSSDGGGGGGCDLANLSDTDDVQDRSGFVAEYNRLAGKHGIRLFAPDDYIPSSTDHSPHHRQAQHKRAGWFSRTFLRQPSAASSHASGGSSAAAARSSDTRRASHKRSVSDLAIHIMQPILKRDSLKGEDLQSLVRLCGKSILYLPSEYAPGSLVLPTCFRATAQYLVQHGECPAIADDLDVGLTLRQSGGYSRSVSDPWLCAGSQRALRLLLRRREPRRHYQHDPVSKSPATHQSYHTRCCFNIQTALVGASGWHAGLAAASRCFGCHPQPVKG